MMNADSKHGTRNFWSIFTVYTRCPIL